MTHVTVVHLQRVKEHLFYGILFSTVAGLTETDNLHHSFIYSFNLFCTDSTLDRDQQLVPTCEH